MSDLNVAEAECDAPVGRDTCRFLLLTHVFPPMTGGSGRWFWELYGRMPRCDAVIAAGSHPQQVDFDASHDLDVARIPLEFPTWGAFNPQGTRHYWRALSAVREIVRSSQVHSIHCGTLLPEGALGYLCRCIHGLPYLCYVHGEELNVGQQSRELGWMMRRVLSAASIVVANSGNTLNALKRDWSVPDAKLRLLHPGTDTLRFVPAAPDQTTRRKLGWLDRTVMLTVGRLQRRKGHDQLIRALNQIRTRVPDVLYSIVGDGEERQSLQDLVSQLGLHDYVQFRGETTDNELIACYQQCDLFVLPNREIQGDFEGFGMVLVEAQSCGKPVVAGRSGGTRDAMQDGVTGRLVDCDDVEQLSRTIIALLDDGDGLAEFGRAAREFAVAQFDWQNLSVRASEIFRELDTVSRATARLR